MPPGLGAKGFNSLKDCVIGSSGNPRCVHLNSRRIRIGRAAGTLARLNDTPNTAFGSANRPQ
jgi:hypothetical protein